MTVASVAGIAASPARAIAAYGQAAGIDQPAAAGDFGAALSRAIGSGLKGALDAGAAADAGTVAALSGGGDLTHVVAAVSRAELALQTTVAVRDRVVQAYQDIMRMPI